VTVLGLDPAGNIQVLFPDSKQPGDGLIKPGTTRASSHYVFQAERPAGMSLYKAIATREPVDFSSLVQAAAELGRGAAPGAERGPRLVELTSRAESLPPDIGPLAQLLIQAAAGNQRTRIVGLPLASWGLSEARVEVVEAPGKRSDCPSQRGP
jgi:hypothetical protein